MSFNLISNMAVRKKATKEEQVFAENIKRRYHKLANIHTGELVFAVRYIELYLRYANDGYGTSKQIKKQRQGRGEPNTGNGGSQKDGARTNPAGSREGHLLRRAGMAGMGAW